MPFFFFGTKACLIKSGENAFGTLPVVAKMYNAAKTIPCKVLDIVTITNTYNKKDKNAITAAPNETLNAKYIAIPINKINPPI